MAGLEYDADKVINLTLINHDIAVFRHVHFFNTDSEPTSKNNVDLHGQSHAGPGILV